MTDYTKLVEALRCGECRHDCKVRDDWFCADGERKEAEHE